MRLVFLFVLVIGIGIAGYAVMLISGQFSAKDAEIAQLSNELRQTRDKVVETTPVVATAAPLDFAHQLVAEDLKIVNWPTADLPEHVFNTIEEVIGDPESDVRYVRRKLDAGEPLLRGKITNFGEDIGITTMLAPGTRAFALRVDVASGVSGFIQPGDEVDIYWTGRDIDKTVTRLILEKVKVIAIDQKSNQNSQRANVARTVTVQVSPDIVANLVQFQASGSLSLSLRGRSDTTTTGTLEVNTNSLIGNDSSPVVAADKCYRRERRGVNVIRIEVPCQP